MELKVALKMNKYVNMMFHGSLFNWQAIIITDQPGNTIVYRVINLVIVHAVKVPCETLACIVEESTAMLVMLIVKIDKDIGQIR